MHPIEIIAEVYGAQIIPGGRDTHLPVIKCTRGQDQIDGLPVLLNVELDKETWN